MYKNINELIEEINGLGDWRSEEEASKFESVLYKVASLYLPYTFYGEDPVLGDQHVSGNIPDSVIETVARICKESGKFPLHAQIDTEMLLKNPMVGNYPLVRSERGIECLVGEDGLNLVEKRRPVDWKKEDLYSFVQSVEEYNKTPHKQPGSEE